MLESMEEATDAIGKSIGEILKVHNVTHPGEPRVGFCLLLFQFGEGGFASYASNAERLDMIDVLKEFLEKLENDPRTPERSE